MLEICSNPLFRQYAVVIAVNLCILATGTGIVWPSPVLVKLSNSTHPVLSRPITEEEGSWIVSIGSLSGIATNLLLAFFGNCIGRKYGLILASLPKVIAGFMFIFATEVWLVLIGRALIGLSDSAVFTFVPMYASEIASKEIRGGLGTVLQIMCSIGVVTMFSVGPFISYLNLNILCTCLSIISMIPLFFLPDSPYFLYSKGRKAEALKVLTYFRGSEALAQHEMKEYEIAHETNEKVAIKDLLKNRLILKALWIVVIMALGIQFIGFNAVSFYLQTILQSSETSVSPEIASVIIGFIQLSAAFGTIFMTDRFGRKPILTVTNILMTLGMFGLGVFFKLKENGPVTGFLNFLPLLSLIVIVYTYSAGFGSLFWVVSAELFEDKSRGFGMSVALISTTIAMFITTKYFATLNSAIGPAYTYWLFSIICILVTLFVMFCIPETKGKSFAEIQDLLRKKPDNETNADASKNIETIS